MNILPGDNLQKFLDQMVLQKTPCIKCGTPIKFVDGVNLAKDQGITDSVIICPHCQSIFTVDMSPNSFSICNDVTSQYRRQPPILQVKDLEVYFGGIHALHSVSLVLHPGEIVSVIGANGAGKSTLLKTVAGAKEFRSGSILFQEKPLPKFAYRVVREGITLVPEGRRIFAPLSVQENLMLGAYTQTHSHDIQETMQLVFALFPVLKERINQKAGTLSGGEQQMLAVGRALMSRPCLLLLDEPSLGLAPIVVETLFDTIVQLNQQTGLTILLVEQNASLALDISHRSYVLETGEIKMEGLGKDLLDDPRIKESYLGLTAD